LNIFVGCAVGNFNDIFCAKKDGDILTPSLSENRFCATGGPNLLVNTFRCCCNGYSTIYLFTY